VDYREFDHVRDNLVTRERRAALNEVFADFDPLAPKNSEGAKVQALGDDVAEKLRAATTAGYLSGADGAHPLT
jgi:hypothetical protein